MSFSFSIKSRPAMSQDGAALLVVLMTSVLVIAAAYYFMSKSVNYGDRMGRLNVKNEIVNDRNMILFDISHRSPPSPVP